MNKRINNKFQINKGFSLLETMVAITILMTTIVGPLALASKGIVFSNYVKDEITAFYLAQEAIETIRNIKDTNVQNAVGVSEGGWLKTIKENCMTLDGSGSVPCTIDIWRFNEPLTDGGSDHGVKKCIGDVDACERLNMVDYGDEATRVRMYGHDFTTGITTSYQKEPSMFSRKITITNITKKYLENPAIALSDQGLLQLDDMGIDEINVTVEVKWFRGASVESVRVSENLFSM